MPSACTATCLALVPVKNVPGHYVRCSQRVNALKKHLWCPPHHKAERSHYNTYKHHSHTLDNFDNSSICTDSSIIMGCGASEILAGWVKCLRKKLNLCDKVIRGRRYHHDRFHAGGDSEHLYYLSVLAVWRAETENALQAVNRRHDEICGITSFDPEDLDDEEVAAVLDWDATPPSDVPASEDPYTDRFEEDQRRERSRLIERLFAFRKAALLHGDDTRSQFIDYMERLVILAIRERSGLRALLHGDAADVDEFLRQEIVTLEELKHIYVAVHVMSPRMVLGAIIDAFRPPQESHDAVLGRRIYREEYDGEICFTAWDLFEDVMPCRHCALQGCHRLEEWNKIDRLATLSLRFLNWQPENLTSFSRADTLFHLSGVFAERKWERFCPKPFLSAKHGKLYVEIQRPAGLYLKFSLENTDTYHRFLQTLQTFGDTFSVLSWAPAFTDDTGTLIPRARTQLCASRIRMAKRIENLPDAPWNENETILEREVHALHRDSDPQVLHMIVFDATGGDLRRLKDNLALAFLWAEQLSFPTPRGFVAAEMRRLLDAGAVPDFGVAEAGLLGIACGAIDVRGESFRLFRQRCVALVETLADADMVVRWKDKKRKPKQKAAVECWKKWKSRLDRMACLKDFFYLGTEEGETHLREKLGRIISPTDGALVKYDEVFQRALDRSEAVEKMLPPRTISMDWDGEIKYPEEMTDIFSFMREDFIEETSATIIEVQNELPAPIE